MTADDDDLMSGIRGMRDVLGAALASLRGEQLERPVTPHEWTALAVQYAQLAELESARAEAAVRFSEDFRVTGPAGEWSEYTPNRIVTDCDGERYRVCGYLHDGHPMLTGIRMNPSAPVNAEFYSLAYLINEYPPVTLTDDYVQ